MIRDLVGDTMQSMLESELDDHLGYENITPKTRGPATHATVTAQRVSAQIMGLSVLTFLVIEYVSLSLKS